MDDRELIHARALLLEIAHMSDPFDPAAKDVGFSVIECGPDCGWDDGRGRCGRPLALICTVFTYDQLASVIFCEQHGMVMKTAMEEFKNMHPRN